jgi:CLN3 protein
MENSQAANVVQSQSRRRLKQDLVAFWILGLCNNYGYVVMLTAATDIVKKEEVIILSSKIRIKSTSAIYFRYLSDLHCQGEIAQL